MRARVWAGLMVLAATALVGCARGPDAAALRQEVQEKLTKQVKDGLVRLCLCLPHPSAARAARRYPPESRGRSG